VAATAYDPTEDARKRNLIWLGVVILIGFLMPVIGQDRGGETKVAFPNIEALGEGAPAGAVLICLYPLFAGAAVIFLATLVRGPGRSAALIGLGVLFLILVVATLHELTGGLFGPAFGRGMAASATASMVIGLCAFIALLVGIRARYYRPVCQPAAIIGMIGAFLYFLTLVMPVGPSIPLIAPFQLLSLSGGHPMTVLLAFTMLGTMGCLIAASVLCIINGSPRWNAQALANRAFSLLVFGFALQLPCALIMVAGGARGPGLLFVLFVVTFVTKVLCWILGLLLLIPVGLTDLLVNLTPPGPAPAGHGPATPPSGTLDDPPARLAKLKKLLDDGLITPEEYERGKSEIMARL
jgi:hypothetical protein